MIWLYLVAWIGFLAVNTSMAEMASMYAYLSMCGIGWLTFSSLGRRHLEGSTTGK
jgi:hypothetical protein